MHVVKRIYHREVGDLSHLLHRWQRDARQTSVHLVRVDRLPPGSLQDFVLLHLWRRLPRKLPAVASFHEAMAPQLLGVDQLTEDARGPGQATAFLTPHLLSNAMDQHNDMPNLLRHHLLLHFSQLTLDLAKAALHSIAALQQGFAIGEQTVARLRLICTGEFPLVRLELQLHENRSRSPLCNRSLHLFAHLVAFGRFRFAALHFGSLQQLLVRRLNGLIRLLIIGCQSPVGNQEPTPPQYPAGFLGRVTAIAVLQRALLQIHLPSATFDSHNVFAFSRCDFAFSCIQSGLI
mmetsp:Transcript_74883/g.165371  ORF Transcript_74883/g.165371 Transcript_74883/m.165371 type:complete len:291 (-) Transcript_74883:32-904(-)